MSRSYKKPHMKEGYGTKRKKVNKNYANRRIRRKCVEYDIADGSSYRKITNPWDICDFIIRYEPKPWVGVSYRTGELEWVEPDPLWKWNRK
jgi:hypothetical protein